MVDFSSLGVERHQELKEKNHLTATSRTYWKIYNQMHVGFKRKLQI